jgi:hypothetical protein
MEMRLADTESGNVIAVALSPELIAALVKLPEQPAKYFKPSPSARLIPVDTLVLEHLRVTSIKNANTLMTTAYRGIIERRHPITVTKNGDQYFVIDGNSTAANAIFSGWRLIQAEIIEGDAAGIAASSYVRSRCGRNL